MWKLIFNWPWTVIQANESLMYICVYKLICNCPWLNLMLLCNIKLKQAYYKKQFSVLFTYKVMYKCPHRLYYVITVVDINLILHFFIIGDVSYLPSARLNVDWNLLVFGNVNKSKQVIVTFHCLHCVSLYVVFSISW